MLWRPYVADDSGVERRRKPTRKKNLETKLRLFVTGQLSFSLGQERMSNSIVREGWPHCMVPQKIGKGKRRDMAYKNSHEECTYSVWSPVFAIPPILSSCVWNA